MAARPRRVPAPRSSKGNAIDINNIWGTVANAIQTRRVAVVWKNDNKGYSIEIEHATGTIKDIKLELEKETKVRWKRQVLTPLEDFSNDTVVNTIPPFIFNQQIYMTGDASVDVMDIHETKEEAEAAEMERQKKLQVFNAVNTGRLRTPLERADDHRKRGNDLYNMGCMEEALDLYTRAVNALHDDVKAMSNRSAAYARLGKFKEALFDADMALGYDPNWAKLWGRKGLCHYYLKDYDEAVVSFQQQLDLDPDNIEARKNVHRSELAGGDLKRMEEKQKQMKKQAHERMLAERERLSKYGGDGRGGEKDDYAKYQIALEQHEDTLKLIRKERREGIARWKRSCRTELERPEENKAGSPRVDVFGILRGACRKTDCQMWYRDLTKMHGWSDTSVLNCETCNASHQDHEDCGTYLIDDPKPPKPPGRAETIAGVHHATEADFKAMANKGELPPDAPRPDPTKNIKTAGGPQTLTTDDFTPSAAPEERPPHVDIFDQCRGHCSYDLGGCGEAACPQYRRPEAKKKTHYGELPNFNDVSVLKCARCGCDVSKHVAAGNYISPT